MNSSLKSPVPAKTDLPFSHLAESRLLALDGLRGVEVLMLLVRHHLREMLPCNWLSNLPRSLFHRPPPLSDL
jgi:hypothetical protein